MGGGHGISRLDLNMELGRQLQLGEVRLVFPVKFVLRWSWLACVLFSFRGQGCIWKGTEVLSVLMLERKMNVRN